MVIVRSAMPGRVAIGVWPSAVVDDVLVDLVGDGEQVVLQAARPRSPAARAREKTLPEGLLGLLKTMARVRGVTARAEPVGVEAEVGRLERHPDRHRAGDDAAGPVVLVERLEDDDLVAGIEHGAAGWRASSRWSRSTR